VHTTQALDDPFLAPFADRTTHSVKSGGGGGGDLGGGNGLGRAALRAFEARVAEATLAQAKKDALRLAAAAPDKAEWRPHHR